LMMIDIAGFSLYNLLIKKGWETALCVSGFAG